MKKCFSSLIWLLLTVAAQAQISTVQVVVDGFVTKATDGAPVTQWAVWAYSLDSSMVVDPNGNPVGYGFAETDADGHYHIDMTVAAGADMVFVATQTTCPDPTSPPGTVGIISQQKTLVNGAAQADFAVCADLPPAPDCWANAWYQPALGLSVQFFGEGYGVFTQNNYTYAWDFGDGTTSAEQNPVHAYAAAGDYIATLTATSDSGCVATTQTWVTVLEPFNGPTDTVLVTGHIYSVADSTPVEGWWTTAWGIDPWFPSYAVTDGAGYYELQIVIPEGQPSVLVETYDCTGAAVVQDVALSNGAGVADFYLCADVPPTPGCYAIIRYEQTDSLTYQFYADVFSTDSLVQPSYLWDFGDGTTSTEQNPEHTYAADGIYTVSLITSDSIGCQAYACEIICTIGGGVVDTFWYGCQAMFWANFTPGNAIQFFDASFGAVSAWAWDFGDGATSTEQNPTHTYADEGTYTVTLSIITADGCESTMVMDVWVGDNPWNEWGCQAMFLPLPDSTSTGFYFFDFSSAPTPITSWTWDFGDGTTSTEQNPYHAYAQPGVYTVSLTIVADSCNSVISFDLDTENPLIFGADGSGAPTLGLSGSTSKTSEKPAFEGLKLFPNPASAEFTLRFDSRTDGDYELRISDLTGKVLRAESHRAAAGPNAVRADLSQLPQGFYLAQIVGQKGTQAVKFAKQ